MKTETLIAAISAAIAFGAAALAFGAAALALWTARGASRKDGYELARGLYRELTSPETAAHRSALEFYRRAARRTQRETEAVLDHYFALLWAFEHVRAGRQSLDQQRRINGTKPVVDYLDSAISWHVQEWSTRWTHLRQLIQEHVPELDDRHSISTFCELADEVLGSTGTIDALRAEVNADRA
ncbi:hypothetical protein [Streptomyces sp. NPDC048637]|uniref:hypothetical protein n=1 Tax=Streptomyces sp. NPDC048637 TaxID=3155636 RepID=UPI00342EE6A6